MKRKDILIIAHRGASKSAPENTMKAFKRAIELNADYIEFDVHETKDGEIVIMHDENTHRTTGVEGEIKEMTLDELKELECGKGEKIPTLKELISLAKGKIGLQCEIKVEGITEKIVSLFEQEDMIDDVLISSFKRQEIFKINQLNPDIKLASLFIGLIRKSKRIEEAINNNLFALHPFHWFASNKFIKKAHEHGIKVNSWTVDSAERIKKLVNKGVDGIITNDVKAAKKPFH
ncbi:MAG: glycerophosphodiester phosphodiesterase family protein [Promethearchaeia archaeon]